jgi:hypothetical protein
MIPSGLVMTRLPVPVLATATNKDISGAQQTEYQKLSAAEVCAVQVNPSELVITRLPVPESATTTNRLSSLAQHTDRQLLSAALALTAQLLTAASALA